jgi:hypothetical protein
MHSVSIHKTFLLWEVIKGYSLFKVMFLYGRTSTKQCSGFISYGLFTFVATPCNSVVKLPRKTFLVLSAATSVLPSFLLRIYRLLGTYKSRDSSVGIALGNGLDDPGF